MGYFDDALALVDHAKKELPKIQNAYRESLAEKTVKSALLVEIKNFMENLRSALDFCAHGLFERYGSSDKADPKIYFPYARSDQAKEVFQKAKRIEACIPGIAASRPDVVHVLEELQHFSGSSNKWLPVFMDLNNENKHQRLTPQVRRETKEMNIGLGGASIRMTGGARIVMGPGSSIQGGGAIIRGGQQFDVNNPPRVEGGTVEIITWVSFHFDGYDQPVLGLLEQALTGVDNIVGVLSRL